MLASAVRRLDEHVVGLGEDGRVADDRRVGPTEIAREDERSLFATGFVSHSQADDRRAEDVAGVQVGGVDAGRDLDLLLVVERPEMRERGLCVVLVVERLVEVDLDVGRLGSEVGLGIGAGD